MRTLAPWPCTKFLIIFHFLCCRQGTLELTDIAKHIDACQHECGLNDAEKHEEMLNFGLVEVVYEWSRGMVGSGIPSSERSIRWCWCGGGREAKSKTLQR